MRDESNTSIQTLLGYCNRPFRFLWNQPFRVFDPTPRQASCYITPIPPKGQNPEPLVFESKYETTGDINEQATQQQRIWQTRTNQTPLTNIRLQTNTVTPPPPTTNHHQDQRKTKSAVINRKAVFWDHGTSTKDLAMEFI